MRIYDYCLLALMIGLIVGGCSVWLFTKAHLATETALGDRFRAIAADALCANHETFLHMAEGRLKQTEIAAASLLDKKTVTIDDMIKPVRDVLTKVDAQLHALEVKREGAYQALLNAVSLSNETQQQLRGETGQLLQALRTPNTRGRWGEIQVRRILEMTGMSQHARDFSPQYNIATDNGALRPDYVVGLPGARSIVIDSKVPLASYLDSAQTDDPAAKQIALKQHALQMRAHVKALAAKAYWDQIEGAVDFVVLFVPGDHFLAGALDTDPDLIDFSAGQNVVLATPLTLVALLRTVALSWRQENLNENARKLGELGGQMYAALATMTGHVQDMGDKLSGSLTSYNKMIGSLERNVLSKARRMRDYGAAQEARALPDAIEPIDLQPRSLITVSPVADEVGEADKNAAA